MAKEESNTTIIGKLKDFTSSLDSYKKDYENVFIKISNKLPEIEKQIDQNVKSAKELKAILDTSGNKSNSKGAQHELQIFNSHLNTVIETLVENRNIDKEIFEDLKSTIDISNSSISKIKDIDNISENLKVFAINSIVYAGHAGEKGKGYQLISGEFIKLSEDLSKSTIKIKTIGNRLNLKNSAFLENVLEHDKYNHEKIEVLSKESKELIENSNNSILELITILDNCVNHINSTKEPTFQIMLLIQKQDIIHQQMEHMHEILTDMTEILENKSTVLNEEDSEELQDLLTLLNFLLLTTEKQMRRINVDLLSMINEMEKPLNLIIGSIKSVKNDEDALYHNPCITDGKIDILKLIHSIFSKPQLVINNIYNQLLESQNQKDNLVSIFKEIDDLMIHENSLAKEFIPQMDMIKNLLFLAHVEQERNQLDIIINTDDKNSVFSNDVFEKMDNIIGGIGKSQEMVNINLHKIIETFKYQKKCFANIEKDLNSSLDFLKNTGELFDTNYQMNINITSSLSLEVQEYRDLFAKLRNLHNNMNVKIDICTNLKDDIKMKLQRFGGLKNLNDCSYRETIIKKILDNLTVDEERTTILEVFPELEIEKSTGSSVTLF